ncbi:MAG: glycosyltransferase family 4 protein [Bacteroidia bacterium]|jgi:glycosyltransferase involved in cell wall biosynthesis|nr:glycosyltransferase family 4 protein [Bacteroidia bacterium]
MKILQISNRVPWPLNEGGTIGIYNYTRAFSELGHEVSLYCLDGIKHNTPIAEAQKELSKYANTLIHPIDTDIKWDEAIMHLIRNKSYNVSRFYNRIFEQEIIKLLKDERYDIVQLEGTYAAPYIAAVRDNHKGLIALRMHNVEYEIWERLAFIESNLMKKSYFTLLAKQLKAYEAKIIQEVDVITTVTDDDGEKFKKLHSNGEFMTIPAGIDLREWTYTPSKRATNWYHIGSMEWYGNVDAVDWYLKEVHPRLAKLDTDYKLHLAGKSIQADNYQNLPQLEVHSNVPRAFHFVRDCDVCVVPLRSGSGIRLKILEAMAAGKLVVSTTIGAQGIDYISGTHLLIADTTAEFEAVYSKIIKGEIDRNLIVVNARKLIEESYSTEALAKRQLDFYSKIES